MHYTIVGAGPAGVRAAETIRKLDHSSRISLIGAEQEPPYSRMAIPYLLSKKIHEEGTYLHHDADFFQQQQIDVIHKTVSSVDATGNLVRFTNGDELTFDKLLLATGASPINPVIPGIELPGVNQCWTLEDARAIIESTQPGASVILMGAGFIGCIILESLVKRGVQVTVVERETRMVPRMMNETASSLLKQWCESKSIKVVTGQSVIKITKDHPLTVTIDSGLTLSADLVISATGVRANIEFLKNSSIEIKQGILVNQYLQTNHENIYAAGDVAQGRDFSTDEYSVQAIQPTAVEHGRIAAVNMVQGNILEHQGSLNMNVLDTLGLISTSFGQWMGTEGGDEISLLDSKRYKYINLQFKEDYLIGVSSLGHTENIGVARGLIRGRVPLGKWKQRLKENPTQLMEAYLACSMGAV